VTGKERILKTLNGEPVDRVPIWLLDPFANDIVINDWTEKWMKDDPLFIDLRDYYRENCELIFEYKTLSPHGICNRILATPPRYIRVKDEKYDGDTKIVVYKVNTPKGDLQYVEKYEKNLATPWSVEHPLKTLDDAKKLLSVDGTPEEIDFANFFKIRDHIGDRGVMMVLINTPIVTVSSSFKFEDFLVYTITEYDLIKEMTHAAYERIEAILKQCIDAGLGPIFRLMGSEQCTPPMNSLEKYLDLVYKYEKDLIAQIHESSNFAAVHCHGNVRAVLPYMVKAGVDMLDPVEAPPSGDVTFSEAKQIVGRNMTLTGNIQYDDLSRETPERIREQVKNLFADGQKDHVIISCTGYPITYMGESLYRNYKELIDAGIEYGSF
jgi:uroporphyrinogen-III decarboxylase